QFVGIRRARLRGFAPLIVWALLVLGWRFRLRGGRRTGVDHSETPAGDRTVRARAGCCNVAPTSVTFMSLFGRRLEPPMPGPVHAVGHQLNCRRINEVD